MEETAVVEGNTEAARAVGRCHGALFFSVFGGVWLLLALYAFHHLGKIAAALIAIFVALFFATALRLRRRGRLAAENAYAKEVKQRNDRLFGINNAVTYTAVFLLFLILPRVGLNNYIFPAFVLFVGLHFFAMPPLYRHRANFVTGACLVAWAILCPLLFSGDRMIGFVALGAGVTLWTGATWALRTAHRLLHSQGL